MADDKIKNECVEVLENHFRNITVAGISQTVPKYHVGHIDRGNSVIVVVYNPKTGKSFGIHFKVHYG